MVEGPRVTDGGREWSPAPDRSSRSGGGSSDPSGHAAIASSRNAGGASLPRGLHALDGGSDIVLDRSPLLVGRHPECDARIDSVMISRHHCIISADGGEVVIRDLGSTN